MIPRYEEGFNTFSDHRIATQRRDNHHTRDGNVTRYFYQLTEGEDEKVVNALHGYVIAANGQVQMAIYFDDPSNLETARAILSSLDESEPS